MDFVNRIFFANIGPVRTLPKSSGEFYTVPHEWGCYWGNLLFLSPSVVMGLWVNENRGVKQVVCLGYLGQLYQVVLAVIFIFLKLWLKCML